MKVLLFGGSGMVGKELTHALNHHAVVAPSRDSVDITDAVTIESLIAREKPDFIVNSAAIIDVNTIERDPELAIRVNAHGASVISRGARVHTVPQLLISSSYVFRERNIPYSEDEVRCPSNKYGETKAEAEEVVEANGDRAPWYIVRSSWIYSRFRSTFVDEAVFELRHGRTFDASTQYGNLTSGTDFASAVVAQFVDQTAKCGIYHIVNDGSSSRHDIACEVARILDLSTNFVNQKDYSVSTLRPSVVLSNNKLSKLPKWQDSLRKYIRSKYGHDIEHSL